MSPRPRARCKSVRIDPRAIVDTFDVGARTRIYEFTHVLAGAVIGSDCNLNSHVFVENDVVIGDRVTLKCGVYVWDGLRIEDDVFVGPNATFTNDNTPRSRCRATPIVTRVRQGASIGAGAIIGPGVSIGRFAFVGMGAVVTRDVADHAIVWGTPARRRGWACFCGKALPAPPTRCAHSRPRR